MIELGKTGDRGPSYGTRDVLTELRENQKWTFHLKNGPIAGSPATRKSVAGIINLFVVDLFGTGGHELEQRVLIVTVTVTHSNEVST